MSKQIYLSDSQTKIMEGINLLADAVQSTLGPSGKTVIIAEEGDEPFATKDGVTVANCMNSRDPVINVGMQLIKKVASKMDFDSGDGTTTVTVLCRALIKHGLELKAKKGFDEHAFKETIYTCLGRTIYELKKHSREVLLADIGKVALTSTNNDKFLANLFQEAFNNSGTEGYINIVESVTGKSYVDIIKGYVVELGYMERAYANNPLTGFFEAPKCSVLVYDNEFTSKKEIMALIRVNNGYTNPLPILIIAKDYSKEVQGIVEFNNMDRTGNKICLIKNPLRNDEYNTMLQDIAQYTNAEVASSYSEYDTELGIAYDLVVKQGYTVMGEIPETERKVLDTYLSLLEQASEQEKSGHYSAMMLKRVARMRHGVTTFYVGGDSDIELKEKKHRVEDAYKSCKAALKDNVIMGGGQSLVLITLNYNPKEEYEMAFYKAMFEPFNIILKNSLHKDDDRVNVSKQIKWGYGYNAKTREYEDLHESGIIDPVSVQINALTNAVSIALTVLSTECLIVETPNQ